MKSQNILEAVAQLSVENRQSVLELARQRIAGKKPELAHYQGKKSKYPTWFTMSLNIGGAFLLMFLFIPSAIRVYHAGAHLIAGDISDIYSQNWLGICAVMGAEIGQVLFSLMAAKSLDEKTIQTFNRGAGICMLVAVSGSALVAGIHALSSPFAFLETFAPPVLTMITANVFKQQILDAITERMDAQREYDTALEKWTVTYDTAHLDSRWQRFVANAIRDAIMMRETGRRPKFAAGITRDEWQQLVDREWDSENWYVVKVAESQQVAPVSSEKRPTPKLDVTMKWLSDEANFMQVSQLSNLEIGQRLGVSHTLVGDAKRKLASQNGHTAGGDA